MKTDMSPFAIEDTIRKRLSTRYKTALVRKRLEIADGVRAEFDIASQDGHILGQIKSSRPSRKGKRKGKIRKQTQFGDLSRDCLVLAAKKEAKIRLFVLTDKTMYREFVKSALCKAAKVLGVETILEPV